MQPVNSLCTSISQFHHLKGGLSVLEQRLEVGLVPFSSLGRGLVGVGHSAEGVVARSRGVAGAVGFTSGLSPDEGVDEIGTSAGRGADTEAGTLDVAPVTPFLTETGHTVAVGKY